MQLKEFFPMWEKLSQEEKDLLSQYAFSRDVQKGTVLHDGSQGCTGLLAVVSGQLRAYILSSEGREITIYRLFERDICLFSASCMMNSLQFDVQVEAEKDTRLWVIPAEAYKLVMERSAPLANYTNQLMASRFSDVMWLVDAIMWKSQDKRLAGFLAEESALEDSLILKITHEKIAAHLGTAREVVTRMLRYLQGEGLVKLTRGTIEILDRKKLMDLSE